MVKLDNTHYAAAYDLYRTNPAFFPLIGAVLLSEQDGVVYADDTVVPHRIYVEHVFGFAQVYGSSCAAFDTDLEHYLLIDRAFSVPKVRLYTPCLPEFLRDARWESLRSFRQRFLLNPSVFSTEQSPASDNTADFEVISVDQHMIDDIERLFGVVSRFWRSSADFLHKAHAVVTLYRGQPVSLCYAAAEADHRVEIDVLTRPEYRKLGGGKLAVRRFVAHCVQQSLQPLWDCFANNLGSMQLARSTGFVASHPPYPFFTITK